MIDAFISRIKADPDDDLPRLVFADWLDENSLAGDELGIHAWWAGMIRAGCMPGAQPVHCDSMNGPEKVWGYRIGCLYATYQSDEYRHEVSWRWVRGMVEEIICPWHVWEAHGDSLIEAWPIRQVRLTVDPTFHELRVNATSVAARFAAERRLHLLPDNFVDHTTDLKVLALEWPGIEFIVPVRQGVTASTVHFYGPTCTHPGCNRQARECYPLALSTTPDAAEVDYYCRDHCSSHGYCEACGRFLAGADDEFDMTGICSTCKDQLAEDGEGFDEEEQARWDDDSFDDTDIP